MFFKLIVLMKATWVLLFVFLSLLFWWKLLGCFCLCFQCLKFLHKKNCPNGLTIYTTWHSFYLMALLLLFYYFVQLEQKTFVNLPKDLREGTQTAENTKKWSFFITLNTPPWQLRSNNKIKTIRDATICRTLIVLCNSNISHSSTCLKTWGKRSKQLETLKNDHFEHFSQKKNNSARH